MSKRGIVASMFSVCLVVVLCQWTAVAAKSDPPASGGDDAAMSCDKGTTAPASSEKGDAACSEKDKRKTEDGAKKSRSDEKRASAKADSPVRLGAVQKALRHLVTIPRPRPRALAQPAPSNRARSSRDAGVTTARRPGSISSSGVGGSTIPNRLGLQHADSMRDTLASPPVTSDRLGVVPPNDLPGVLGDMEANGDAETTQRAGTYGPAVVVPGYAYRPSRRLPSSDRSWNNYRYYGGRPSRYGYGMNDYGSDSGGDVYRFGFNRGYDSGRFDKEGNERTSRLLAHARGHLERGLAFLDAGRYRAAGDAFKLAAESNHGDPAARLYAAHALFATGRYRDGVKYLRRAFELQPKIVYLNFDMRDDYGEPADFDQQLAALESASKRFPRNVDRLIMLGYVYYYSDQRDKAYAPLDKANQIDPRDRLAQRLLDNARPPDVMLDEPVRMPEAKSDKHKIDKSDKPDKPGEKE